MISLEELSRLAETINQETDSYTQSLAELEKKLVCMNLGIEAWVPLNPEVATSGIPERNTRIRTILGFAKTTEGWGFAVQDVRIDRGFLDGDPNCPYENRFEDSPPKLLLKSSRELRILAAGRIEEVLDALKLEAEETISALKKAAGLARKGLTLVSSR